MFMAQALQVPLEIREESTFRGKHGQSWMAVEQVPSERCPTSMRAVQEYGAMHHIQASRDFGLTELNRAGGLGCGPDCGRPASRYDRQRAPTFGRDLRPRQMLIDLL